MRSRSNIKKNKYIELQIKFKDSNDLMVYVDFYIMQCQNVALT